MRAALSSTPMASSRLKPPRLGPLVLLRRGGRRRHARETGNQQVDRDRREQAEEGEQPQRGRQGMSASNSAVSAGSAALPRSPAKL